MFQNKLLLIIVVLLLVNIFYTFLANHGVWKANQKINCLYFTNTDEREACTIYYGIKNPQDIK